ncbi:YfcC family protein [Suttonella ornithocola]|uniref:C4-dicarboxylate anaerobic carrier n=1 Tax=Suttonella ornithocola TaxID=279832 RepID=A0A380MYD8_9GAMM|nr:Na+/H+ antiporter NhaC family protein [Suttonella ornithocola]SUO96913.1 C4-dicarboxylate anaerobic carrier [Suttonella ornithocola]
MKEEKKKKSFKMPDIYIVLSVFILIAALMTYLIPAGLYERQTMTTAHGEQILVVAGTYHTIEQHPVGFMDIISAIPDGLKRAAGIVFLTFMVGGCMGLIKRAGLIDMGVQKLSNAVGDKGFLVIPILMGIFAGLAAFIGVPELSLAYLPVLLPLFYRLGYDGMTATAVALLGPCMGFTFGLTIPGSVGVGQQIAQLPMFSGSGFRAVVLVLVMIIAIAYVMFYAAKVKRNPEKSLTLDSDNEIRNAIAQEEEAKGELVFTERQKYAGITCLVLFPIAIFLILKQNLGFEAIGGLFLFIGIVSAAVAGKKAQQICDDVNAGMRDMMVAALLCGVASAIAVIMDKGVITDTIVYWLESMMRSVPPEFTAIAIFWEQSIFNFLIPGATALTVLTMPIISPLADLLSISQQAVVSANAWGGQLTDIFFPTSGFFVATLVIAKVDYTKWLKFYTPLMLVLGALASAALYIMMQQ